MGRWNRRQCSACPRSRAPFFRALLFTVADFQAGSCQAAWYPARGQSWATKAGWVPVRVANRPVRWSLVVWFPAKSSRVASFPAKSFPAAWSLASSCCVSGIAIGRVGTAVVGSRLATRRVKRPARGSGRETFGGGCGIRLPSSPGPKREFKGAWMFKKSRFVWRAVPEESQLPAERPAGRVRQVAFSENNSRFPLKQGQNPICGPDSLRRRPISG